MGTGLSIAVVDDDRNITELLREVLSRRGWEVETFASAEEFLASDYNSYRAILLDLYLPGMWGSECAYRLREMGVQRPIVAVTGHADDWDEEDLKDLGFDAVITKPFDLERLAPVLERVMGGGGDGVA